MDNNEQYSNIINDFFRVFGKSIVQTLSKNLDTDVCTNINFETISSFKNNDTESLKKSDAIYRLDCAINTCQGTMVLLIPEELIATISDIITGGNGTNAYKGSISEIETNSILSILEKIFKGLESDFAKSYEHNLVFSSTPSFLLKEMQDYEINTDDLSFNYEIDNRLTLSNDKKYSLKVLIDVAFINNLIKELDLSADAAGIKQKTISQISIDNLKDVRINITAELGRTRVPIKYALELVRGSLVELDTLNNSDIKVFANGVEFAMAQVVAIEDNFGLKITKIIPPEERIEKFDNSN